MKGLKNKNTFSGGFELPQREDRRKKQYVLFINEPFTLLKKVEEGDLSLNRLSS